MKSDNQIFILIALVTASLLIGGAFLVTKSSPPRLEQTKGASIEFIDSKTHDWGQIDMNGGNVEKIFKIKNAGSENLEVTNFKTSCMCTEVEVIINGQNSPRFGMHSRSAWQGTIGPGETAEIKVTFDPLFHGPSATGPITRFISFNTNDSQNKTVEFSLTGNVVKND